MAVAIADTIPVNTTVQTLLAQYESLLEEADRLFQDYVRTHSLKMTCGPTCSDCCPYFVPTHFIEAYYIQRGMQTLGPQTRHAIRLKALRDIPNIERFEQVAEAIEKRSGGVVQDARALLDRLLRGKTKCPFVGEQGGCLVYKYRHPICRLFGIPLKTWGETGEKPLWCDKNTLNSSELIPLDACRLLERAAELSRTLELLMTSKVHPSWPVWLVALVPLEKLIEGGNIMEEKELSPEEWRRKVRRRLLKIGVYSIPIITTFVASEALAAKQCQPKCAPANCTVS